MVDIQLFGLVLDSTLFFQIVMATLGILSINIAILKYLKNDNGTKKRNSSTMEAPPELTNDFLGRKEEQKKIMYSIENKINTIIINGIAGIGKTQLAVKAFEDLKDDYVKYWKTIRSDDNFEKIIWNLADFLKENGNNKLSEYLENGDDYYTIVNEILKVLNSSNYILFFDDYHNVEDDKINNLFKDLKDNLKNSVIILTTRKSPNFIISNIDIKNTMLVEIEGFDLESTHDYYLKKGLLSSSVQLNKIDEKIKGHPKLLEYFFVYIYTTMGYKNIENIIEELPNSDIENYLLQEIFNNISKFEIHILNFLSCLRTTIEFDALSQIINEEGVKKKLLILERKSLVKRTGKEYSIHDSLKKYCYKLIDDKKSIHKLISDYYKSQEKTNENIFEAVYHKIKADSPVDDKFIKYLKGTPKNLNRITCNAIMRLLTKNKIISDNIFELLNEFTSATDITVKKLFTNAYGDFFEKIWAINPEKSIKVFRQILEHADPTLLQLLLKVVENLSNKLPDEACKLWKEIINKKNNEANKYVLFNILSNSNLDSNKKSKILNYLINNGGSTDLSYAKSELIKLGILEGEDETLEYHLENLKNIDTNKKLLYIKQIKEYRSYDFFVEILDNIIKNSNEDYFRNPNQFVEVLKLLIRHSYSQPTTMQRIPRLIAKLADKDIMYLKYFLEEHENYFYFKFVGIRALDHIKDKISEEKTFELLKPMYEDKEPVIRTLANIMAAEIKYSHAANTKEKKRFELKIINPLKNSCTINSIESELSTAEPKNFMIICWGFQKAVEGTDRDIILEILQPINKSNLKCLYNQFINTIQNYPKILFVLSIYLFKTNNDKRQMYAIWIICNLVKIDSKGAIKYLEEIFRLLQNNWEMSQKYVNNGIEGVVNKDTTKSPKNNDKVICMHLLCCLKDIGDELHNEKKSFFEKLSKHPDGDVRGYAKLMLNGLN